MTTSFSFELINTDPTGARRGRFHTQHGVVETPIFMPVGTSATVKAMLPEDLKEVGAQIILGNTYHLFLRPGHELIARLGGLHRFMNWHGPILTDSGGYQVFSLGALRTITEEGVSFRSHIDGSKHFLNPENVMEIQHALGSDIMMQLDECPPYPADREYLSRSLERSLRWGGRCLVSKKPESGQALFGIMQGGMDETLRRESASGLIDQGYDGYALGGLSVGEPKEKMLEVLSYAPGLLPKGKPRYLMGVGKPPDLVRAVESGVDMFDCVIPTRNARNGQLFTKSGPTNIKRACYREDPKPVEEDCPCNSCQHYSRAYLHHLFRNNEIIGHRLMTQHNLMFYLNLMRDVRVAIERNEFKTFRDEFLQRYENVNDPINALEDSP